MYISIANKEFYMSCVYTKVWETLIKEGVYIGLRLSSVSRATHSVKPTHTSIRLIQGPPFWTPSSMLLFFSVVLGFFIICQEVLLLLLSADEYVADSLASFVSQFNNNLGLGTPN